MALRSWDPWRARQEGIPSWVGLSLTALYLGLVLSLGAASLWAYRSDAQVAERTHLKRWTACLGRCVELASAGRSYDTVAAELRRASREPGIQRCEIVDGQGRVLASSETRRTGQSAPAAVAGAIKRIANTEPIADADPIAVENGDAPGSFCIVRLQRTRAAPATAGEPAGGRPEADVHGAALLVVQPVPPAAEWTALRWWSATGYIVLAGLGVFWMLYRMAQRALRPMAAIRQRLLVSDGHIEEQLSLLRVNDSMDEAAGAWNRLIEFVNEMHEQLKTMQLRTAVDSTLTAYRSERLAAVLRQMPHGVLVIESSGQISFANRSAERMLGRTEEDLSGKNVKDVLPEPLRASIFSGGRATSRWIDYAMDGTEGLTTIRFTAVPLDKDDGQAANTLVFLQDVSQFKEVERARDAFLYHVTHELRTPLTNIRAYAETLAGGVLDDEASLRECYNVISGETERLTRLVENILNVSQLEVGTARLNFGEVHIDRLIRDAVQDIQAQADAKGIDLRLRLPPKVPAIRGDKERLAVVVANLLGNAMKYTSSGGHVELACTLDPPPEQGQEPETVQISVSDTGIGIAAEHHEKIFEKFYRVDDERVERQPGTGLGLSIVKETVRLHGGTVSVESTPGRGTTFRVVLPVAPVYAGT